MTLTTTIENLSGSHCAVHDTCGLLLLRSVVTANTDTASIERCVKITVADRRTTSVYSTLG
jgi:hypothetical protein